MFVIGFFVCLIFLLPSSVFAAYITELEDCNAPIPQSSRYTVLDKGRNTLGGWSHINADKFATGASAKKQPRSESGFQALAQGSPNYQITQDYYMADKSCAFAKIQNGILVVKLSDWEQQHLNGFEAPVDDKTIKFGEVGYLLLDLRVNSIGTTISSREALRQRYDDYLTDEEFARFDEGNVTLGFTLFEEGALDASSASFNLELLLSIDQSLYFDKWIRIVVPLDDFHAFTEKNYVRETKELNDYKSTQISGFRINPESTYGLQLRNLIGDKWTPHIPETYKEMSLSLRRVEFLKRH